MRAGIVTCGRILLLLMMVGAAWAPAKAGKVPAVIRRVEVSHQGAQVRVRVVLSRPVLAQMQTATKPERVLVDFPETSSSPHQHRITLGKDGVRGVRYGLNQSSPPVTRLVVDLEEAGKCALAATGNEVVLTIILPAEARVASGAAAAPRRRHAVPPAAANAPWISVSGNQNEGEPTGTTATAALPAPSASPGIAAAPSSAAPPAKLPEPQTTATFSAPPSAVGPGVPMPPVPAAQPTAAVPPPVSAAQPTAVQPANAAQPTPAGQPAPSPAADGNAVPQLTQRPGAATTAASPTTEQAAAPAVGNADLRTVFRVKYVADGAVYLDGGRADGLAAGIALVVKQESTQPPAAQPASGGAAPVSGPAITAHLKIISVAQNSAVCEVSSSTQEVKPGDLAYLTSSDAQALVEQRALSSTRVYPQVITFTEGDPMDEEVRDEVPRPPLPEVNRTRVLLGFDYGGIQSRGSSGVASTSQYGMVMRADMTRIGGSYWNLHGYWRGELNSQAAAAQPTIQDMMNRTYTIGFTYDNPHSRLVAGVGRLYLPWATSLDVIDGGYGGLRFGKHVTAGLFAGTSPDPTSWSYNPERRIAGNFVNFSGGTFDDVHYTSTVGMGVSTLLWQMDRPFVFMENGIAYKQYVSVYEEIQADKPRGTPVVPSSGAGVSRSYVSLRVQPIRRLALDFNHNYFRDVPTYQLSLVGTGLLDTVLFQGFSGGARVETVKKIYLYTELGRSSRSGDTSSSLNQMYGITFGKLWNTGLHADLHYAKFNSSFARGNYRAISLSRNFGENLQAQVQVGKQAFVSPFSTDNGSKFVNTSLETQFGAHYFLAGGYNLQRGLVQNYDQWYFTLGYRFDNRSRVK